MSSVAKLCRIGTEKERVKQYLWLFTRYDICLQTLADFKIKYLEYYLKYYLDTKVKTIQEEKLLKGRNFPQYFNPFPLSTNLQQMTLKTLKTYPQKIVNFL